MPDPNVERLDPISGRVGTVGVTLTGVSFRRTDRGRRYPYPDFGSDFIQALHDQLVTPRWRGLLGLKPVCPWCDASLDGVDRQSVTVAADVVLKRIPPIHVDVEMPGAICPRCAGRVVAIDDTAVAFDFGEALVAAFKSVSLAPG